jgi:histidine triad (HIT) family protein
VGEAVMPDCPFCARIAAGEYSAAFYEYGKFIAVRFMPLEPVTPGHMLYIPVEHILDAAADPALAGKVLAFAAEDMRTWFRKDAFNLITSVGEAATQSVFHLHWHGVPRFEGDGLALPWTGQRREGERRA